jgi:hypothetical protein
VCWRWQDTLKSEEGRKSGREGRLGRGTCDLILGVGDGKVRLKAKRAKRAWRRYKGREVEEFFLANLLGHVNLSSFPNIHFGVNETLVERI